jgi:hypothetical protein
MPPSDHDECPLCGADLRGDPIPQEYIDQGYYRPGVTHYSRQMGHQITGVYDGVLYWSCPDCGGMWNRWDSTDPMQMSLWDKAEAAMAMERAKRAGLNG